MIGLIALAILIVWGFVAAGIAAAIVNLRKWKEKRGRFVGTAIVIFLLPFAEEIFMSVSFGAHCLRYGGITSLNPVQTNAVSVGVGWSPLHVLEHPSIDQVEIRNNTNKTLGGTSVWVAKTSNQEECSNSFNDVFLNSPYRAARVLPMAVLARGECYLRAPTPAQSSYSLSLKKIEHTSFSALLPYKVYEDRFVLSGDNSGVATALSTFSALRMRPGRLFLSFFEHYPDKTCKSGLSNSGSSFPFDNEKFEFLSLAIKQEA